MTAGCMRARGRDGEREVAEVFDKVRRMNAFFIPNGVASVLGQQFDRLGCVEVGQEELAIDAGKRGDGGVAAEDDAIPVAGRSSRDVCTEVERWFVGVVQYDQPLDIEMGWPTLSRGRRVADTLLLSECLVSHCKCVFVCRVDEVTPEESG